jgi:hypothetical protein
MAYSQIEQSTLDLDLFLKDKNKFIHIASGGGKIPNRLANSDNVIEDFKETVNNIDNSFEIEINPELSRILNIEETELETYLSDFLKYAKLGFFTYDKTKLGEFDDMTFHLVAKPIKGTLEFKKSFDFVSSENILPETFNSFTLTEYIE